MRRCEICKDELSPITPKKQTVCIVCKKSLKTYRRNSEIQSYFSEFLDRVMAVEERMTKMEDHFHAEENWAKGLEKRLDKIIKKI